MSVICVVYANAVYIIPRDDIRSAIIDGSVGSPHLRVRTIGVDELSLGSLTTDIALLILADFACASEDADIDVTWRFKPREPGGEGEQWERLPNRRPSRAMLVSPAKDGEA